MKPPLPPLIATAVALLAGVVLGALGGVWIERKGSTPVPDFMQVQRGHLSRLDGASAPGRVVFLGSSTFQGLDVSSVTPVGLNLGLGSDTVPGLLQRLRDYASLDHARAVLINIGLNDLMQRCALPAVPVDEILHHVPLPTPVILLGVQGIDPGRHGARCEGHIAQLISSLNEDFVRACALRTGCRFVPHPIPATGQTPEFATLREEDGVHLSPAGYRQLVLQLREALAAFDPSLVSPPHLNP
ncbi:SGNH/GDSL hydrolase family protein [Thauera sp. 63]|jgi:lysophospholipase L1-like esterase|uniref:SGNH/GDSL hydrolase family protein n=1 Tax=Thauera sp. 63 TaxID=497321 RepID=UPI0002D0C167|nr:SGNH/GDSL hydrolase family protein [Thauera sp. 63]ENO78191.1 G-D-S-L family lipolytic protein [Thauera sp. 63]